MKELVEYEPLGEKSFDIPSRPGAQLTGPDWLTFPQRAVLANVLEQESGEGAVDGFTAFLDRVLVFYATLPDSSWNLARRSKAGKLVAMPLDANTIRNQIKGSDFSALALDVAKHLVPEMFTPADTNEDGEDVEDLMEGLGELGVTVDEPGSEEKEAA